MCGLVKYQKCTSGVVYVILMVGMFGDTEMVLCPCTCMGIEGVVQLIYYVRHRVWMVRRKWQLLDSRLSSTNDFDQILFNEVDDYLHY